MIIIPAIDIVKNKVAILYQGKIEKVRFFGDPLKWLRLYALKDAVYVNIIDIEAAMEIRENQIIETLIREGNDLGLKINVGGGIRSFRKASRMLEIGADKIIISSLVFSNLPVFREILERYSPERVIVATDILRGKPVIKGWRKTVDNSIDSLFLFLKENRIKYVLTTNVERDGTLKGFQSPIPLKYLKEFNVIVAGGISSLNDLYIACSSGAWGAVLGKAIYEDKIDLDILSRQRWCIKC